MEASSAAGPALTLAPKPWAGVGPAGARGGRAGLWWPGGARSGRGGGAAACAVVGDQAVPAEDAPEGAARGRRLSSARGDMVGDGLGSGVVTRSLELLPQLEHGGDDLLAGRSRR